jgi:MYXO-CTERM domain-containing protein
MISKLAMQIGIVVVAVVLTFAPVFAQDTGAGATDGRTTTTDATNDDGPELGWLGLIGLVGLGGLMRRDRNDRARHDRGEHR